MAGGTTLIVAQITARPFLPTTETAASVQLDLIELFFVRHERNCIFDRR
jgi:hypothetical protein